MYLCLQIADKAIGIPPLLYGRTLFPEGHQQLWGCPARPLLEGTILMVVKNWNKSRCKGQRTTRCFPEPKLLMLTCSKRGKLIHCLDPSREIGRQSVVETLVWTKICAAVFRLSIRHPKTSLKFPDNASDGMHPSAGTLTSIDPPADLVHPISWTLRAVLCAGSCVPRVPHVPWLC